MKDLLHNSDPQSTLYLQGTSLFVPFISENERFDKDFAVYDKRQRENERMKKDMIVEKHRLEKLEREAEKWEKIEKQMDYERQKKEFHGDTHQKFKRNGNGQAFNPISLAYEESGDGEILKQKDDDSKVKQLVRAHNLDTRSNCGYNILTGEQRQSIKAPENLNSQYEKRVKMKDDFYGFGRK